MGLRNQRLIQRRYEGFLDTPQLWENKLYGLQSFTLDTIKFPIDTDFNERLRLGKYVEQFFAFQIKKLGHTEVLAENIQIQKDKITLGELDFLIRKDHKPIHIEVVYKFYLYDKRIGNSEIDHLIGPNRKDSLIQKLTKLKNKQLPLLFKDECSEFIHSLDFKVDDFQQQTCFKGQIFVPFHTNTIQFNQINKDTIAGRYLSFDEINRLLNGKFYIPAKKDWLIKPHESVDWLPFEHAKERLSEFIQRSYSPLCWVKFPKGQIEKVFVTWWS